MTKLLFTSVYKPYGVEDGYNCSTAPMEPFVTNIGDEGIFNMRYIDSSYPLQFIAQNLKTRSVVLDFPSRREFVEEIKRKYDYVCISFIGLAFEKLRDMCQLIRDLSPESKIVIGGYGTIIPGTDRLGDYLCRGEGVEFMRNLLGEEEKTFKHPVWEDIDVKSSLMGLKLDKRKNKPRVIVVSLGCDGGCEFCATCHFFDVKKIHLLKSAKEIYDAMESLGGVNFHISDEDFLKDKKLVRELGKLIKKNNKVYNLTCMSTPKSAAYYKPQELLEIGFTTLWISVESKFANYAKLKGVDMAVLVNGLHEVGISTILSLIIGYDFHNKEILEEEIGYFFALNPTYAQVLIYTPPPGTPLYKRLENEKRLINRPWKEFDGSHLVFRHPYLSKKYLENFKRKVKQRELEHLGPSVIRSVELKFSNYLKFKNSKNQFLMKRAKENGLFCYNFLPFLYISQFFVSSNVRKKTGKLINKIHGEFGEMSFRRKAFVLYLFFKCFLLNFKIKLFRYRPLQPSTMRAEYNL